MLTARKFNTEGPVVAADHYHIPPLERIDLDAVLGLIRDKKYFVLHAPRQNGKTSALLALRDLSPPASGIRRAGHGLGDVAPRATRGYTVAGVRGEATACLLPPSRRRA